MRPSTLFGIALAAGTLSFTISTSAAYEPATQDAAITSNVKTAIFLEPELRMSHLYVHTDQGVVRLAGAVEKAVHVKATALLAGRVPGVVRVESEMIEVKQ